MSYAARVAVILDNLGQGWRVTNQESEYLAGRNRRPRIRAAIKNYRGHYGTIADGNPAIKQAGLPLAGWIANRLADHGELVKENIAPLDAHRRAVVGRFALPIVRRSRPLEGSHVSAAKHVIGVQVAVSHKRNSLVAALETM